MTLTRLLRRGGSPESGGKGSAGGETPGGGPGAGEEPGLADTPAEDEPPEDGSPRNGSSGNAFPADAPSADAPGDARTRRPPDGRLRRAALAGTVAVLVLGGCGFFYGAHQLRSAAPARNHALTDTEATARVAGDVGNALARVFSYTPDGTAAAARSARTVLDGRAARQYETLFARVRDDLTEQRVTLSTRAVRTGVLELDGDRARLLVFLDQTSRRGEDAATTAAAQLTVTARLEDDRWRIVDIKAR
ncbi:hypothetical protein [Streptomyces sp.]|uniref:hypothetical protein n=1 Tax=Streptomyces sp. TaxID=1931 RepID=UPI0028110F64|nr:hypothetical protein [Streptomyces sp.]